ncbi:hypothetical protein GVN18_42585 [Pseudomonas sp. ODNR1LW]|nr:hypothetical protein [Pseudomonas sp. ODNR1LW]
MGVDINRTMLTIPNQPYEQVFGALESIGLQVIGADFISGASQELNLPPEFQPITQTSGFSTLWSERAWSDVKNVKSQRTPEIVDISGRFATYHRLLAIRIREISEAYKGALTSKLTDIDGKYIRPEQDTLFSNGFQAHIEAAIHAFLADAAAFRDLIAESIWKLILKNQNKEVTTFGSLIKKTKNYSHKGDLLSYIHRNGSDGGWIKNLTDIRNSIIHVAPLANANELQSLHLRTRQLKGGSIPIIHYPLTTSDGRLRTRPEPVDFDDHENLKARFQTYHEFVKQSGDALIYARNCLGQLVELGNKVREAANLQHKILTITDADIIGPIRIHGGK